MTKHSHRIRPAILYILGSCLFLCIFYFNAWIHDDAFITFRSVEQVFAGHGAVWNPHERVQVYTHPLWIAGLLACRFFSSDLFLGAIALSLLCWIVTLAVCAVILRSPVKWLIMIISLVSAKSIMDFSSSGLENPLSACLIVTLLALILNRRSALPILTVSALLALTRHDLILVALPAICMVLFEEWKKTGLLRTFGTLCLGMSPLIAWTIFSLVYYGFPFPNSAYAKLGTGLPLFPASNDPGLIPRALTYFRVSMTMDPMIPIILLAAAVTTFNAQRAIRLSHATIGTGILIYLGYILTTGGDYMAGRFLAVPTLAALVIAVLSFDSPLKRMTAAAVALLVAVANPVSPIHSGPGYSNPVAVIDTISDERSGYFQATSLHHYLEQGSPQYLFAIPLLKQWHTQAMQFKAMQGGIMVAGNLGILGYYAGPDKIILDVFGVTDPLLARLPGKRGSMVGHYYREIPKGYDDSVIGNTNIIEDVKTAQLYDDIKLATQGPLFSTKRFSAMLRLNFR